MQIRDFSELSLSEMFAEQVRHGRMFHDEILGVAQRTAGHRSILGETPSLPRLVLRLDLLEPGDVLLMRGEGGQSTAIAGFSGGDFSHAALWINPLTSLESDGESDGGLIGPKHTRCFGTARQDGQPVALGEIVGAPLACEVYRHPGIKDLSVEQFAAALEAEMHASYGKDYSEYYRLVAIANLPGWPALSKYLVPLATEVTRACERRFSRDKIHGPFCSELVARFFRHLGLPLFNEDRPAEQISPNDLGRSALDRVEGAVVDTSRLQDIYHDDQSMVDVFLKLQRGLVERRREQRDVEKALNAFNALGKWLKEQNRQSIKHMAVLFTDQIECVRYILRESANFGEPYLVNRALRLSDQYAKLASQLFAAWGSEELKLEDVDRSGKDWSRVSRSLVRCQLLLTVHQFKRQTRDTKPSSLFHRFQNWRWRRRLLDLVHVHRPA
jgi:hypothetical protein